MVSGQSRQLPFTVWVSSGNERLWIHGILKFGSTIRCTQRIQFHNPFFPWLAECWQIVFNITALNFYLDPVWVLYFRFFYFFNKNIQENASKMPTSNTAKPKRNPTEFEHPKEQEQDFFFFLNIECQILSITTPHFSEWNPFTLVLLRDLCMKTQVVLWDLQRPHSCGQGPESTCWPEARLVLVRTEEDLMKKKKGPEVDSVCLGKISQVSLSHVYFL